MAGPCSRNPRGDCRRVEPVDRNRPSRPIYISGIESADATRFERAPDREAALTFDSSSLSKLGTSPWSRTSHRWFGRPSRDSQTVVIQQNASPPLATPRPSRFPPARRCSTWEDERFSRVRRHARPPLLSSGEQPSLPVAGKLRDAVSRRRRHDDPHSRSARLSRRSPDQATHRRRPASLSKEMQFERAFVAAGGRLMAGSDPTGWGGIVAGFGNQRQVELLVGAGLTAEQAIRIASANGADFLLDENIGRVATGCRPISSLSPAIRPSRSAISGTLSWCSGRGSPTTRRD